MNRSHHIKFFNFFKWLSNKYITLEQATLPYPCKIIRILNKNRRKLVQIQFSGQNNILEVDPRAIINNNYFEYFSSEDKKQLFSLFYNKENFKLSDRYFCETRQEEMIVLTDLYSGNKITLSARDVSLDQSLVSQLHSKDANKIGFLSGLDSIKKAFRLNHEG